MDDWKVDDWVDEMVATWALYLGNSVDVSLVAVRVVMKDVVMALWWGGMLVVDLVDKKVVMKAVVRVAW